MPDDAREQLESVALKARKEITGASDLYTLETVRVRYLGRKGEFSGMMRRINEVPSGDRPAFAQRANELKEKLFSLLEERSASLQTGGGKDPGESLDTTLPGRSYHFGRLHPLTLVLDEIYDIFREMGFDIADGPEIETVYNNFDALNTPKNHTSRDPSDTYYIEKDAVLLRTHTSPVQIRTMTDQEPPVRIIAPGRCYRNDAIDATHMNFFHQVEGLYVDEGVNFSHLKGVILTFARSMFGNDVNVRFRPHYFPFTEPSIEYDFSCVICGGEGCRTCKGSGWLEISGAGMVHPEVFRHVGYDSDRYTGYAFGMGVERIAMIKFGINDIRLFFENDLRFLNQF